MESQRFHASAETHTRWMTYAMQLAEKALPQDVPVGAVILNANGIVLGEGWNTREKHHSPTGHAELTAITQACQALQNWRLTGCTLYVTLEPCPMCASALLQSRIDTIVYGTSDPIQGALGSALDLASLAQSTTKIIPGILEVSCRDQLQTFFQSRRRLVL